METMPPLVGLHVASNPREVSMKTSLTLLFLGTLLLTQGCGDAAEFSSGIANKKSSSDATPNGGQDPRNPNGEGIPGDPTHDPNGEGFPDGEKNPNGETIPKDCPEKLQDILVLDMKSGWWAGDAGEFFTTLLRGLTEPCGDTYSFEFHHILETSNTYQVFPGGSPRAGSILDINQLVLKQDWGQYSQIWLLSGSVGDPYDMRASNPVFLGMLQKIHDAKVPLFLGSGNGNLTHVNALLTKLQSATQFTTNLPEGPVVNATGSFTALSHLKMGEQLTKHNLFARGIMQIADAVQTQSYQMRSDFLQLGSDFVAIGSEGVNRPLIAVSAGEGRRIVLDSGLQRFYVANNSEEKDTLTYLQNLAVYLSH